VTASPAPDHEESPEKGRIASFGAPVARERLSDSVATQLTELIASGALLPGTTLPNETELAAQFGVGKSAVREAAKILSTRGMLTVQQGLGTVVNPRERWNLQDEGVLRAMRTQLTLGQLIEVRSMIEPEMAALAARRATPEDLERLRALSAPLGEDHFEARHAAESLAFHEAMAEAAHNPVLGIVFSTVRVLLQSRIFAEDDHAHDEASQPDGRMTVYHRAIFEAIEAGDADLARERARMHLVDLPPYLAWASGDDRG
jgi:Transcriptional regulators